MASDNQSSNQPLVGVIMGSDSDLPVMKACAEILKSFDVPFEISIISAHRTFSRMVEYTQSAQKRGLKVIIAAACGAAALPGMVAALTSLPVIGVPIQGKCLDGVDSLYSIVQMPVSKAVSFSCWMTMRWTIRILSFCFTSIDYIARHTCGHRGY